MYQAPGAGAPGSSGFAAAHLVGLLPPPLGGVLMLVCPQLTLVPNAGCRLPLNPIVKSILASTGGLPPWSMLPGLLLLLAGFVARRRSQRAQGPPAAQGT